jgi:hypothetical protein
MSVRIRNPLAAALFAFSVNGLRFCALCGFILLKAQPGTFNSLRYNDDFSGLRNDTNTNLYKRFKYKAVGKSDNIYFSHGGEIRVQAQHYTNENWGDIPQKNYVSFYQRVQLHSDLHMAKRLRFFVQANHTYALGRVTGNRSIDQNTLAFQQAFAAISLFDKPQYNITLSTGRQELLYGSQRIIAVREGPNNRQSFDAVRLLFKRKNAQVDAFYAHPVAIRQGVFDDRFSRDQTVWSFYSVFNQLPVIQNADFYYIGYHHVGKAWNQGLAAELRHSFGMRIWKKAGRLNYDFEALWQSGHFGTMPIKAYTASLNLSYKFDRVKWMPVVGFKSEVISGDRSPADSMLNTFNPLYPRGAYFGLAALIGPANLIDFHPMISFSPSAQLSFTADYDVFWRHRTGDGLYGPNVMQITAASGTAKYIGQQLGLAAEFSPSVYLTITAEALWFDSGDYIKQVTPGRDVWFSALTAQFKF